MSDTDTQVPLQDLNATEAQPADDLAYNEDEQASRIAADLEAVFDVPVQVSAVPGRSKMAHRELLQPGPGPLLEPHRSARDSPGHHLQHPPRAPVPAAPGNRAEEARHVGTQSDPDRRHQRRRTARPRPATGFRRNTRTRQPAHR